MVDKSALQDALWEAIDLQVQAFKLRIQDDLANNIPTDAATLNAITAAAKVHGITLNAVQDDAVDRQRKALDTLRSLDAALDARMKPLNADEDDEIRRIFQ